MHFPREHLKRKGKNSCFCVAEKDLWAWSRNCGKIFIQIFGGAHDIDEAQGVEILQFSGVLLLVLLVGWLTNSLKIILTKKERERLKTWEWGWRQLRETSAKTNWPKCPYWIKDTGVLTNLRQSPLWTLVNTPVSLIQYVPSGQFVFELVSRDCQPLSHFFSLSLSTSLEITLLYYSIILSSLLIAEPSFPWTQQVAFVLGVTITAWLAAKS